PRLTHEGLDVEGAPDHAVAKVAEPGDAVGDHRAVQLEVEHHDVGRFTRARKDGLDRVTGCHDHHTALRVGGEPGPHPLDNNVGVLYEGDADGLIQRA